MLKRLSVKNFQKHAEFHADFKPGLNLIVGPNWAGKSTLQRAVLFALFGSSAVPVKVDQLIRSGERSASVTLVFDHFQVDRSTKDAVLTDLETGQVIASGQTSVTAEIESILGISSKNFLAFHVARQKEAGSLLSLGSAKLAAHINAVTGVDLVDTVLGKLRDETNRLGGQVSLLEEAEANLERAVAEADLARHQRAVKDPEREAAKLGYTLLDQAHRDAWTRLETAQKQAQQCAQAWAQLDVYLTQRTECVTALTSLIEPIPTQEAEVEAARAGLQQAKLGRLQFQRWEADFYEAHESLGRAKDRLVELASVSPEAADVGVAEEVWRMLSPLVGALKERAITLHRTLGGAVCHACHRPMEGVDLEQIERDLAAAREEFGLKDAELQAAWEQLNAARLQQQTWETHQRWIQEAQRSVAAAQERFDALSGQAWEVETDERIQERQEEVDGLVKDRAIYVHWQTAQTHLENTLQRLADQIAQLPVVEGPSEEDLTGLKEEYLAWQLDLERAKTSLHQLDLDMAEVENRLTAWEGEVAREQATVDGGRAAKARLSGVTKLSKYLRDNRDRFSAEVWEQLLGFAGQFIAEATSGKVTGLLRSPDGDFQYVEDGETRDIELASGLQEDILGVGLKLALGAALGGPVDFMLFDEVSAAGEDENALLLTSLLKEAGQQVILISHRTADCAVADWVVPV